MVYHQIINSII